MQILISGPQIIYDAVIGNENVAENLYDKHRERALINLNKFIKMKIEQYLDLSSESLSV